MALRVARLLVELSRQRVARVRASVHTKLLFAFLIITALFIAMAVVSLMILVNTTEQSRLLEIFSFDGLGKFLLERL